VVPNLGTIIENPAFSFFDDFFKRRIFKGCSFGEIIYFGNISLVVLAIMEFYGFFTNVRFQGIFALGYFW
jgi:hypothetical protein